MRKIHDAEVSTIQFPVVGIGASAGGLDAVIEFLKALPAKPGMAFVFVQHMSPDHQSILPEILQKVSPFPVHQITDNIHLEPDNLYIIPSNKIVTAIDGVLKLAPLNKKSDSGNTVNLFFSSLGVVHQSYAVGIVLSGALYDGTLGLQIIKSYGGITFAQEESSAAFESMPRSAIRSGVVDFILSPGGIARQLIKVNNPFHADYTEAEIKNTLPEQDSEIFKQILTILRVRRGVDFAYYKQSTLKRRIIRRIALSKAENSEDYLVLLRENKAEQDALYNDMLISVTNFFRDTQTFELLCTTIFPDLIAKKGMEDPLRIWIAGCATGEEAYSMAICLQELLGDKVIAMKIQIFATDISEMAINKARTGIYNPNELSGVSESRLEQFFVKQDGSYQVIKTIRDMCVFAHHNLLKDPPFSKIDLVSCRNVLIYMEPVLQKRALTTFHYSLNEYSYLMLGKSESIGNNTDIFTAYNSTEKIYLRKGPAGRFMSVTGSEKEQTFRNIDKSTQKDSAVRDVFKVADDIMLADFMPASVLVNEKFDIIQFRGVTETWLVQPAGKPSFNLLKLAREGLSFELRNILHLAKKTGLMARKFAVSFKVNGLLYYANVHAIPLPGLEEPHYLLIFQNASSTGIQQAVLEINTAPDNINYNESEMRIEQLEKELLQVRADMRAITEEQETANEELQSANEELLSGSEELQSLNEELETSKEELQSTNEEIMIVNKELLNRNEQLNDSRLYNEGIVSTIRDPLLILNEDLRVKRATGGFYSKFRTNERETEGHYIYDLGNKQWDIPKLRELLEHSLPANKMLEDFEVDHIFPDIGRKIMRLNARLIDKATSEKLILVSIEDITDNRKVQMGLAEAERLLSESRERLKFAVESAGLGIWDFYPQTRELIWDKRCREIYGFDLTQEVDVDAFFSVIHPDDRKFVEDRISETFRAKGSGNFDVEYRTVPIDDRIKWLKGKGRAYFNEEGDPVRFTGTLFDITFQKIADEATRELLVKKDEFISIASHELKTPITSLKAALQIIDRASAKGDTIQAVDSFLQKALRQVDKLTGLVKDLLDVTKIQSGKLVLRKAKFSLDALVKECVEEQQNATATHTLIIESDSTVVVDADKNRIEQVLVNLISNAVKYSPDADKVIISLTSSDHVVKVSVTDFGIGMPKDKLPLIFDRFYRVDESSQRYAGLGLGLYISAEIIQRHGGHISIESELGKGSTFWFVIPV